AQFTFDPDLTVMPLDDMLDNGQAQSGSAHFAGTGLVHPVKTLKDPGYAILWNPNTGVTDDELLFIAAVVLLNLNMPTRRRILDRIVDQIDQYFPDLVLVGPDRRRSQFHR